MNDIKTEGIYEWSDGTNYNNDDNDYSDFAQNEPNDWNNKKNSVVGEDCVMIWSKHRTKSRGGKWNDAVCNTYHNVTGFICNS